MSGRLPDFVIIGAMKCATSTLHYQLAAQPGVFMCEPKEPNFFSDSARCPSDLAWYRSLFADAPADAVCGESSTRYTKLPDHPGVAPRLAEHLPDARLIYVMRHPIDRLVSHYIHAWTERLVDTPIDDAVDRHPELVDYGRYAMQLRPYVEAFGRHRILPVFHERLRDFPEEELRRVAAFIGCRGDVAWDASLSRVNVSTQRLRRSRWRDALLLAPGLKQARQRLIPRAAREWAKRFWRIGDRPELSPAVRARLEGVFDQDLATLGDWLGVTLTCTGFEQVVASRALAWKPGSAVAS